MSEEKRKIMLASGFETRTRGFGNHVVTAQVGETVEVSEVAARLAVESGEFVYAPEYIEEVERQAATARGELPADFPAVEVLAETTPPITTVDELNHATDEQLLAKEGIGKKTLQKIRTAEKEVVEAIKGDE